MLSTDNRYRKIALSLSACLTLLGPNVCYASPDGDTSAASKQPDATKSDTTKADATNKPSTSSDGDIFGAPKWSIVPSSQPEAPRQRPARNNFDSTAQLAPGLSPGRNVAAPAAPASNHWQSTPSASVNSTGNAGPTNAAPLKLYGRIEELCSSTGAKIPLKMVKMTPIRDTSMDVKLAAKATTTTLNGRTSVLGSGQQWMKASANNNQLPPAPEPAFPFDYRGSWSGDLSVYLVDVGPRNFDFDRVEAEQEQRLLRRGRVGRCTVTFFDGNNNRIDVQPTQVVFSAPLGAAVQEQAQGNSTMAALAGLLGSGNPMLANMNTSMEVPEFTLPLGMTSSGQTSTTGNQLSSELMKNTLKELAKNVLEQQVVTKDTDRNKSGQVRNTFTESDLQFSRISSTRLYLQAAAVSYDSEGNYLNKVVLKGMLDKGAKPANANPNPMEIFGQMQGGNGGGGGSMFDDSGSNSGGGGLGGLGGLLGGQGGQGGGAGGLGGLGGLLGGQGGQGGGSGGLGGLGGLLGGQGGQGGGSGGLGGLGGLLGGQGGQGGGSGGGGLGGLGGLLGGQSGQGAQGGTMGNQMQEVQKMLKEMGGQ